MFSIPAVSAVATTQPALFALVTHDHVEVAYGVILGLAILILAELGAGWLMIHSGNHHHPPR